MKRTGRLGSIHYDEQLLLDLWKELATNSDSTSSTFTVYHGFSSTEFETPEELENATQIPDRISRFELTLRSSEGHIRISANSNNHRYTINGEEDWVRRLTDHIREFNSERENRWRTTLNNKRLSYIQIGFIGALIGGFWNKITALILPFYFVEVSPTQWRVLLGLVLGVVLLQISKLAYPSVEFRRRGSLSHSRQAVFVISLIGSVATIVQGLYWLI